MKIINLISLLIQITNHEYKYLLKNTNTNNFTTIYLPLKNCYIPGKCGFFSCSIKKRKNFVNINFTESKSNCKNGPIIWKNIYKNNEKNKRLTRLISGVHFSINTHVCFNYYNFVLFYKSNLEKYRLIRKYFLNFVLLFYCVRKSIFDNLIIEKSFVYDIDGIIREISCIDCDKCKVLGTLQFEGLKACILKSNGELLSKYQKIYLILFYKKILRTLSYVYYLEKGISNY